MEDEKVEEKKLDGGAEEKGSETVEERNQETVEGKKEAAPPLKKIALKVPSLFIKPSTSSSQKAKKPEEDADEKTEDEEAPENVDKDKPCRPMPASVKQKLEKKQEEDGDKNIQNDTGDSKVKPKPNRPMPASARRKLEQTSVESGTQLSEVDNQEDGEEKSEHDLEVNSNSSDSKENNAKIVEVRKSRPMPASAKHKFENLSKESSTNDVKVTNSTSSSSDSLKVKKRPMPASVKRKLESSGKEDEEIGSDAQVKKAKQELISEVGPRPVESVEDDDSRDGKSSTDENEPAQETSTVTPPPSNPDSPAPAQEQKKINISLSLGGIRLPTFKKTSNTPSGPQAETKQKSNEVEPSDKVSEASSNEAAKGSSDTDRSEISRRSVRRSEGVGELMALEDPLYECEYCGTKFTKPSNKKKHVERVHLGIKDDKNVERKKELFKKTRTCPICNETRNFSNRKMYRDHVRKCKTRKTSQKSCALCDKTFSSEKELIRHIKAHADPNKIDDKNVGESTATQLISDSNDASAPASPMSVGSNEDKGSRVSSVHSMPDLEKQVTNNDDDDDEDDDDYEAKSRCVSANNSLRHRLAQAITNFTARKRKEKASKKPGTESIEGRPMPASIKKKLEERGSKDEGEQDLTTLRNKLTCRVCHQQFFNRMNRIRHEKNVHKLFQPDGSTITTTSKQAPAIDDKECKICHQKFTLRKSRIRHEYRTHGLPKPSSSIGPLNCRLCFKAFSSSANRAKHEKIVHVSKGEELPATTAEKPQQKLLHPAGGKTCRYCGAKFNQVWKTKRHERNVHIRKGHKIPKVKVNSSPAKSTSIDDASSASAADVDDDVGTTSPVRNEKQCRFCGKTFTRRYARIEHEHKVHRNESKGESSTSGTATKPVKKVPSVFDCEVCFKRFSQSDNRRRHERSMHGIANPRPSSGPKNIANPTPSSGPKQITSLHSATESELPEKKKKDIKLTPDVEKAMNLMRTVKWKAGGRCPICKKFVTARLRRHFKDAHGLEQSQDTDSQLVSGQTKLASLPPPTSSKPSGVGELTEKKEVPKQSLPKAKEVKSGKPAVASSQPLKDACCPSCEETISVEGDFEEYKTMRVPRRKFLITCKICWNMFSHQEDFVLHIQLRHKAGAGENAALPSNSKNATTKPASKPNLIGSESTKRDASSASKTVSVDKPSNLSSTRSSASHSRSLRGSRLSPEPDPPPKPPKMVVSKKKTFDAKTLSSYKKCTVLISAEETRLAKRAIEKSSARKVVSTKAKPKSKSQPKPPPRVRSPTPEPEPEPERHFSDNDDGPMDTNYDDDDDDNRCASPMDVEEDSPEIAITSTFSQRQKEVEERRSSINAYGLNEMPCSTCKEVFYSYEALRKHELYFHNVKTSKICPICGIYPNRLNRHLIAHENNTIKCVCAPCDLSFANFKELRQHNLSLHPDPYITGAKTEPTSKSRKQLEEEVKKIQSGDGGAGSHRRCQLCKREFETETKAKLHIRRVHCELEGDITKYIEKFEPVKNTEEEKEEDKEEEEVEIEIGQILKDTSNKLMDSDWDSDHSDAESRAKPKSAPVLEAQAPVEKNNVMKPRAMPASVRAKMEAEKKKQEEEEKEKAKIEKEKAESKSSKKRPMPASVKAKLESEKKKETSGVEERDLEALSDGPPTHKMEEESNSKPKPISRPMPASVRSKLFSAHATESSSTPDNEREITLPSRPTSSGNVKRPMPASVRAKMKNKAELKEMNSSVSEEVKSGGISIEISDNEDNDDDRAPSPPPSPPGSPEPEVDNKDDDDAEDGVEVIDIDDESPQRTRENGKKTDDGKERDSGMDVIELSDDDENEESAGQSMLDKVAEHERAVRIAMGEIDPSKDHRSSITITYQCKLCNKTFDTGEGIRKHIRRGHSEYGPEHTENLIEQIYEEISEEPELTSSGYPKRNRKRSTRYTEEEYLDAIDDLEEDDEEAEVIIRRGTSTRGGGGRGSTEERVGLSAKEQLIYACKYCGKKMDSPGNTRRHISKAHKEMFKKGSGELDGVLVLQPGQEPPPYIPSGVGNTGLNEISPGAKGYRCRICHWKLEKYVGIHRHIKRSHPEANLDKVGDYIEPIQYDGQEGISWGGETENEVTAFSCVLCTYLTSDEHDYVRHYKKHTGVSPYQCQYCAGTFNRNQQLLSHIEREHTGAEFLNENEDEFSMEDMTGVNEIQVSATVPIQIEQPKSISLTRRYSTEATSAQNGQENGSNDDNDSNADDNDDEVPIPEPMPEKKKRKPGPKSRTGRKPAIKTKTELTPAEEDGNDDDDASPSSPVENATHNSDHEEENEDEVEIPASNNKSSSNSEPGGIQYQGDLSSLFSSLGGEVAPGGLDAIDDIDGGMELD